MDSAAGTGSAAADAQPICGQEELASGITEGVIPPGALHEVDKRPDYQDLDDAISEAIAMHYLLHSSIGVHWNQSVEVVSSMVVGHTLTGGRIGTRLEEGYSKAQNYSRSFTFSLKGIVLDEPMPTIQCFEESLSALDQTIAEMIWWIETSTLLVNDDPACADVLDDARERLVQEVSTRLKEIWKSVHEDWSALLDTATRAAASRAA